MTAIGFLIIALFGMDGPHQNAELMIKSAREHIVIDMFAPIATLKCLDVMWIFLEGSKDILLVLIRKGLITAMVWKLEAKVNFMCTVDVEEHARFMEIGKLSIKNGEREKICYPLIEHSLEFFRANCL